MPLFWNCVSFRIMITKDIYTAGFPLPSVSLSTVYTVLWVMISHMKIVRDNFYICLPNQSCGSICRNGCTLFFMKNLMKPVPDNFHICLGLKDGRDGNDHHTNVSWPRICEALKLPSQRQYLPWDIVAEHIKCFNMHDGHRN